MKNLMFAGFVDDQKKQPVNPMIPDANAGREAALIATAELQRKEINALIQKGRTFENDPLILDLVIGG